MQTTIDKFRSSITRYYADRTNKYCLQASLIEAAVAVGVRPKSLETVLPSPAIPPQDMLIAIQEGSTFLGMELVRVLINPSLLESAKVVVPELVRNKVHEAVGVQQVLYPHIRLLFLEDDEERAYYSHAECDDRSKRSKKRISELQQVGLDHRCSCRARKTLVLVQPMS